ncbi:MAG: LysM peptidoglycan-binding domain-containing protein [Oscillospiraceae bacterium]|nr:LysM peptidoglycan-binding domain-containing protein [Oscillospiraceae bacterium]
MAERTMSVMLPLELPEDAVCQAEACLEAPALAAAVSGGLEVRFAVVFTLRSEQTVPTPCIVGAALSEEEEPAERRPSLVLRRAPAGQRLWDVAKSCGSTVGAICAANGIEGDTLAEDRLLLIPRCR